MFVFNEKEKGTIAEHLVQIPEVEVRVRVRVLFVRISGSFVLAIPSVGEVSERTRTLGGLGRLAKGDNAFNRFQRRSISANGAPAVNVFVTPRLTNFKEL